MNYADRVKETSTTTGTGAIALAGAATGFRTFAAGFAVNATMPYAISDALGNWEVGTGTLTGSTTLARTTVLASSNGNGLVSFPAGSKDVFCTLSAAQIAAFQVSQDIAFATAIPLTVAGTQYMPQQTVASVLAFTVAASPVKGASVYVRLIADGTNAPTFSGMKEWGGSLGYDNRNGIVNEVQFFYDGYDYWYSISQAVGAVPVPAAVTGVTLAGPSAGAVSTASSNFTAGVTPVGGNITGTIIVTPSDAANGGTFAPTSVSLTTASPTATFTYTPASTGAKTISITNNAGLSNPASITYTSNAAATVPSTMSAPVATGGDASASIAFAAPANGGATIIDYTVTATPGGATVTGTASPIAFPGLTNGTPYTFTIKARNSVGSSAASPASNSVTPAVVAATPRLGSLSAITESGTGPYSYVGQNTNPSANAGGVLNMKLPASTDGYAQFIATAIGENSIGITSGSVLVGRTVLAIEFRAWQGYWQMFVGANTAAQFTNAIPTAVGDIVRLRRSGSNIIGEVSKDSGSTWTITKSIALDTAEYHFVILLPYLCSVTLSGTSGLVVG